MHSTNETKTQEMRSSLLGLMVCVCVCATVRECMSRLQQMPRIERQLRYIFSVCLGSSDKVLNYYMRDEGKLVAVVKHKIIPKSCRFVPFRLSTTLYVGITMRARVRVSLTGD